jgi:hypothetical protein
MKQEASCAAVRCRQVPGSNIPPPYEILLCVCAS